MNLMTKLAEHSYILMTVLFTVYSQLVMRWQVTAAGPLPIDTSGKVGYILNLMLNPWVVSGIFATFLAGVSWMMAMTKFEISYAYPFVSLNYILVLAAGFLLFNEAISATKLAGSALVILGIIVIAKG
jgi:drug/metabolite transporter (DMT)-like permease